MLPLPNWFAGPVLLVVSPPLTFQAPPPLLLKVSAPEPSQTRPLIVLLLLTTTACVFGDGFAAANGSRVVAIAQPAPLSTFSRISP